MHCSSFSQSLLQTLKFRDTQDKREKGTKVEHAFLNLSIFHGHVAPAYRRIPTPPHMPCTMGAAPFMNSSSFLRFLSGLLENSDLKKNISRAYTATTWVLNNWISNPCFLTLRGNFVCFKNYFIVIGIFE